MLGLMLQAFDLGYEAFDSATQGYPKNPYTDPSEQVFHDEWEEGYACAVWDYEETLTRIHKNES